MALLNLTHTSSSQPHYTTVESCPPPNDSSSSHLLNLATIHLDEGVVLVVVEAEEVVTPISSVNCALFGHTALMCYHMFNQQYLVVPSCFPYFQPNRMRP